MLDIKELSAEDELRILEEGLRTPFWELLTAKLQHKTFTVMGIALSEDPKSRDWQAGRATGLKEATKLPADRARELKAKIKQKTSAESSD